MVVGVDGCLGGWVAAAVSGRAVEWRLFATFEAVLAATGSTVVGVDTPIGLPVAGRRRSDVAARAFLAAGGGPPSAVFWTPEAAVVDRWRTDPVHPRGIGVSIQTWNIIAKLVDVADALVGRPAATVLEVHPECSFRAMAPTVGFASKKSAAGTRQRVAALRTWCDVPDVGGRARGVFEDALDATAVAWTVDRFVRGVALTLPADAAPGEPKITV